MTLILGMSKAEGIYMSTDYRVTDARSGSLVDDASIKFLTVHYPPHEGGPKALLAYTGLAILPDGSQTGLWLRETLRGESEVFDQSMAHLQARLDRDIAPLKIPLIINAVVVHGARRYAGGLSNLRIDNGKRPVIRSSFGYTIQELKEPFAFANGSGAGQVLAGPDHELLRAQLNVKPRRIFDHMKLLATVNRRVAARERSVSPFCQVSFINADDRTSPTSHAFLEKGEVARFEMPILLFGIDLSGMARRFHEQSTAMLKGEAPGADPDAATINEELKRRP